MNTTDHGSMQPTVLVVDDQEAPRKVAAAILERDYRVVTADGPEQALKVFHEEGPLAAALLDIEMPDGFEGLRLADALREQDPDLPIIMWSGNPDRRCALKDRGYRVGTKPMKADDLRTAIRLVARRV